MAQTTEATFDKTKSALLILSKLEDKGTDLVKDFYGEVIIATKGTGASPNFDNKTVYLSGDISNLGNFNLELAAAKRVFIVRELSTNNKDQGWPVVGVGRLPVLVHGVGVLYRRFFDSDFDNDYFRRICEEHAFQYLTESNKPGVAHRTGIYLTPVKKEGEELHFNLLRCSSNLKGPSENFCVTDRHIVDALNEESAFVFRNQATLNHVLAQIYRNTPARGTKKQTKARIKAHSDKTKDMPKNGIMAFCTFYDHLDKLHPLNTDAFDRGRKSRNGQIKTSAMTTLQFRLKTVVKERPGCTLAPQFSVTLYPDSVFFMPLSTNRLYTHEIVPSVINPAQLPTRLGYVVRCSATEAVHADGQTFLKTGNGIRVKLEPPTNEGMGELRDMYAKENISDAIIDYGDKFLFSMNKGDYMRPNYGLSDEFRRYNVPMSGEIFEELLAPVRFEGVYKGRQGAVLTKPDGDHGIPLVRTTTKYSIPPQSFEPVHVSLAQLIQKTASIPDNFNNALIENYSNKYATMGLHSDQAQDLKDGSHIAIFSCYKFPHLANPPPRKLVIMSKDPNGGTYDVPLPHNSVVVFSLETNRRFRHKIVLDTASRPAENQWLGVTYRTSKTYVHFKDQQACFEDGARMALADEEQHKQFYKLRRRENQETNFVYPRLTYTISESDMMPLGSES